MHKQEIIERYRELFDDLIIEKNLNKQKKIAKEISKFSEMIDKYIKNYPELKGIQEPCLSIEHWKDESGFCKLTKKDIKQFLEKIKPKNLIIAGRRNSKEGYYIKFKASDDALVTLNIIAQKLGDTFLDMECSPRKFEFSEWKDEFIRFRFKGTPIEIICGDKYIHMFVRGNKNREEIHKAIKRYSEWVET